MRFPNVNSILRTVVCILMLSNTFILFTFAQSESQPKEDIKWTKYLKPSEEITRPVVEFGPWAEYSKEGLKNKIEGTVLLELGVNEKGKVEIARVVKGLGLGLDENALSKVKIWKFKPALKDGRPVAVVSMVEMGFHLHPPPPPDFGQYEKVGKGVTPPNPIFSPEPDYTEEGRKAKYQGVVVIGTVVETDGSIKIAYIVRSLEPGLDQKALDVVKKWKFRPAMKDKQPVRCWINIEVSFNLY